MVENTKSSSFTHIERAAWHKERRKGNQTSSSDGLEDWSGDTCVQCGAPIAGVPRGYEGALCGACD
jgi:hypothetical protein